jgi:cell division protease FtsH
MNDMTGSMAQDVSLFPKTVREAKDRGVQTAWQSERLRKLSYTQFLILLREGHIESFTYNKDMRTADVVLKESCPFYAKKEHTIGLIYDPTLYDHLAANDVRISVRGASLADGILNGFLRVLAPVVVAAGFLSWSLTLGRQTIQKDPLFGGARMREVKSSEVQTTFADVAGIDDIKDEVMEVVSFLRHQVCSRLAP